MLLKYRRLVGTSFSRVMLSWNKFFMCYLTSFIIFIRHEADAEMAEQTSNLPDPVCRNPFSHEKSTLNVSSVSIVKQDVATWMLSCNVAVIMHSCCVRRRQRVRWVHCLWYVQLGCRQLYDRRYFGTNLNEVQVCVTDFVTSVVSKF